MFLAPLGEAFFKAGDFEKAEAEFEAISKMKYDRQRPASLRSRTRRPDERV
jgi:hypothetical protein